ncbi:MAG: FAD-binding protein, partial [Kiritimatiellae bacterium]|nr:FAD-binding protein [Kiritimatiellia bacterium]
MQTEECDVLVIGSGAAGLAAAARLKAEGVEDVLVLTESLRGGTSINTGSDKQTYYKLSLCGDAQDSPMAMAQTYFDGGAMHGDIALVEAALSARCFSHLCDIGVPFPHDAFGQYAGYKTDHDPARRATSVGPYTSREMCLRLLDECRMRGVRFAEGYVAVQLLTEPAVCTAGAQSRPLTCTGAIAIACHDLQAPTCAPASGGAWPLAEPVAPASGGAWPLAMRILAHDTVFAVGGPGGLYARSVYPACHTGGIGLAIAAGARARNLPTSQFGLASIKFRWNVSGTYMQVLPRLISTAADGVSDPRDFLLPAYGVDPAAAASTLFLKGYQWPFDPAKAESGSSRIDLLVQEETLVKGRRVFLDYRSETPGLDLAALSAEAHDYLEKSGALEGPPIARLERMNPGAIALYREHGIDLAGEPLEIALCAQHNTGGLAADAWWQSENVAHLWPIGEVNGSHGLRRPGGAALNAGQVGAYRCAAAIAA